MNTEDKVTDDLPLEEIVNYQGNIYEATTASVRRIQRLEEEREEQEGELPKESSSSEEFHVRSSAKQKETTRALSEVFKNKIKYHY